MCKPIDDIFIFSTSGFLWMLSNLLRLFLLLIKNLFSDVFKHILLKNVHMHSLHLLYFVYIVAFDAGKSPREHHYFSVNVNSVL